MTHAPTADPTATPQWPAPPGPLVGGPRDRPQGGTLPTDVDRFRELVWQPLAAADPSGRRWLPALGAFELLRHGAAEPGGVLHATGRTIASMLRVAETTWCRSTRHGPAGYGSLLEAAGLLVREDWERYRLPTWEALQNRAADATLRGRFVYTHRPAFRSIVVRWRLGGVSLAALGAWSLLRYCHTRWDTAELALCDAAIARALGVKPHTWAAYAQELAGCGALQRLRPTAGSGYRLPLYFVLRAGRGLDEALACHPVHGASGPARAARYRPPDAPEDAVHADARNGQVHAGAAVRLHAASAASHAEPAAALCHSRAREDPVEDGGVQEHPGADVARTLELLAAVAGTSWQQEQIRTSTTLRARCAELLARTGWSPQRLAAHLTARELRSAREPVRVLAHRARALLDATPTGRREPPAHEPTPEESQGHDGDASTTPPDRGPDPTANALDDLDEPARQRLLDAARARLRRIGLPRTGEFPDDHPLLRGEAINLLRQDQAASTAQAEATPGASGPTTWEEAPPAVDEESGESEAVPTRGRAAFPQRSGGCAPRPATSPTRAGACDVAMRPRSRAPPVTTGEAVPHGLGCAMWCTAWSVIRHRRRRRTVGWGGVPCSTLDGAPQSSASRHTLWRVTLCGTLRPASQPPVSPATRSVHEPTRRWPRRRRPVWRG